MLEKLLQAAIITFLLYIIAGLNPVTRIQTHAASSTGTASLTRVLLSARE